METVVDWDGLGAVVPGPGLATVLAGLELARVPNDRVLAVVRAQYRQLCHEQARLLAVLDEVARCDAVTTPGAVTRTAEADPFAGDEIRAVLAWTRRAAEVEHDLAQVVIHDLPAVFAAWWAGDIDRPRARVFQHYLTGLTPDQIDRVCQVAVPRAPGLTTGQLASLLRRMVITVDPEAAARWYQEGVRGRGVAAYLDHDGTVTITATGLPADEAEAACQRVHDLATAAKRAGHPGPISHIRADLFLGLLDGRYHHQTTGQIITTLIATYQPTHTNDAVETGAEATGASAPTGASAAAGTGRSTEAGEAVAGTSAPTGASDAAGASAPAEATAPSEMGGRPTSEATGLPGDAPRQYAHGHQHPAAGDPGTNDPTDDDTFDGDTLAGAADSTSASTLDSGDDILDGDHTHADEVSGTAALASTGGLASGAALEDEHTPTGDTALDGESTLSGDGALDHDAALDGDGAMTTSNALPGDETPDSDDARTGPAGLPGTVALTGTDAQDDTVAAVQGDPVEDTGPDTGEPARDERVGIEVRVGLATLLGWDERPGEIPGLGPLLAAQTRTRVAWQRRAQWRFAVTDTNGHLLSEGVTRHRPHTVHGSPLRADGPGGGIVELHVPEALLHELLAAGASVPEGWAGVIADIATQHHDHGARARGLDGRPGDRLPGAGLRRHTQIRDRTCTFPGCRHAAATCHQDHTTDHAHGGPTTAANLGPACPHDHHLKHRGGWTLTQPEPGVFLWRSKLGGTYPTRGQFLHPQLPDPAPAEPPAAPLTFTLRRTGHPTPDRVEPPILHRPPPANPPTPPSEAPRKPTPWHPPDDPPPF